MTIHERAIGTPASSEAAVAEFLDQLTHLPDPDLRQYCHDLLVTAKTLPEMAAAVQLVQDLCACFGATVTAGADAEASALI